MGFSHWITRNLPGGYGSQARDYLDYFRKKTTNRPYIHSQDWKEVFDDMINTKGLGRMLSGNKSQSMVHLINDEMLEGLQGDLFKFVFYMVYFDNVTLYRESTKEVIDITADVIYDEVKTQFPQYVKTDLKEFKGKLPLSFSNQSKEEMVSYITIYDELPLETEIKETIIINNISDDDVLHNKISGLKMLLHKFVSAPSNLTFDQKLHFLKDLSQIFPVSRNLETSESLFFQKMKIQIINQHSQKFEAFNSMEEKIASLDLYYIINLRKKKERESNTNEDITLSIDYFNVYYTKYLIDIKNNLGKK